MLKNVGGNISSIGFYNSDNCLYSTGEDGRVRIWDWRLLACTLEWQASRTMINKAVLKGRASSSTCEKGREREREKDTSTINQLITADQAGSIKLWDLRNVKNCIHELVREFSFFLFPFSLSPPFNNQSFLSLYLFRFLKKMFQYMQ